ncbi:hypothetical protein V3C99_000613 [Haemonchus contortus]
MSHSSSMSNRSNKRRLPFNEPYDHFDWYRTPLPDNVVAVFRRPVQKYDENFNLTEFMRDTSYGEPFRIPPYVVCIRKIHKPIPCPRGDVVAFEHCKGRRDYLNNTFFGPPSCSEGGFIDWHALEGSGHYGNRYLMQLAENSRDYHNNMDGFEFNATTRMRGGGLQAPAPPTSEVPIYQASHVSHHSTASHSTSSHGMEPVGEQTVNVFSSPTQPAWVQSPHPEAIQQGFVNVYHGVAANGQMTGAVVVPSGNSVVKAPPSDEQGVCESDQMAEINEFFVTNPYQQADNPENLQTAQMQSPTAFPSDGVFKSEEVDFGFDASTIYEPVMQQPIYTQQHEQQALIRTAAGGECQAVASYGTPAGDFDQSQQRSQNCAEFQYNSPAAFENYLEMPVDNIKSVSMDSNSNDNPFFSE